MRELFDFSDRCQIVCVDMNLESLIEVDPEKPYESMARRLVYSHWNGGEERICRSGRKGSECERRDLLLPLGL